MSRYHLTYRLFTLCLLDSREKNIAFDFIPSFINILEEKA